MYSLIVMNGLHFISFRFRTVDLAQPAMFRDMIAGELTSQAAERPLEPLHEADRCSRP